MKSVFKPGFMYKVPGSESIFMVAESKTLPGREERPDGEALGRKLVLAFFERLEGPLVQPVDKTDLSLRTNLLTLAELLQTLGFALPPDPDRTSAETERLLEQRFQNLEVERFHKKVEPDAGVFVYSLDGGTLAEEAFAEEARPDQRTKMVLARLLERHGALAPGESLQSAWSEAASALQLRAAVYLPPAHGTL